MGTGPPDAPRPILISLRNSKKDQIFWQWHLNCKHCIAAPTRKLRNKQTICCKDDTKIQTSDDFSNKWATYYRSFAVVCLSLIRSRSSFFLASLVLPSRGTGVYALPPSQSWRWVVGDRRWRQTKALWRARVCARSFSVSRWTSGGLPAIWRGRWMVEVESRRRI